MDVLTWYSWLSAPLNRLDPWLQSVSELVPLPLAGIFLLGVLGAAAPCQLTTGLAALAFALRAGQRDGRPFRAALAFAAGKALVYTGLGAVGVYLGSQISIAAVPVAQAARRLLGPLMILSALHFFGLIPVKFSVGGKLSGWIEKRLPNQNAVGGLFLGSAFAFAFCPTLFVLFFGTVIPRALTSPAGLIYPAVFAAGTALPLLAAGWAIDRGLTRTGEVVRESHRWERLIRLVSGIILLAVGVNDLIVYWLL